MAICCQLQFELAGATYLQVLDRLQQCPLGDEHILVGILSVPDSLAARALGELGIALEAVEAIVRRGSS